MFARRTYRFWGLAAAAWCVAFGLLSLYWAAGGTLGVDQLAVSLQERAKERQAGFVALVTATGLAKLLGAIVPLWRSCSALSLRPRPRCCYSCAWRAGRSWPHTGLPTSSQAPSARRGARWENAISYAVLWGPIWLLGGALFLMTAWRLHADQEPPE